MTSSLYRQDVVPPLSIAPMMDRTDRHYRYFMRRITTHTLLYTEMVTTGAILFGDKDQHLAFQPDEHPISLQLGGDDPKALAQCAQIAVHDYGYDEINLNVGCPSSRVQNGNFGACLMAQPERVAACVASMRDVVDVPVTVKHRIGIDDIDQYEHMRHFVDVVAESGCKRFSVHARKAWLQGLSPKENRNIPPLRYHEIHRLKAERPDLDIEINGGILTLGTAKEQLEHVDAVMIGRAAYDNPYQFVDADHAIFGDTNTHLKSRHEVALEMIPYLDRYVAAGGRLVHCTRHIHNLFIGVPGAKRWRRYLSQNSTQPEATSDVVRRALDAVDTPPAREIPASP